MNVDIHNYLLEKLASSTGVVRAIQFCKHDPFMLISHNTHHRNQFTNTSTYPL